VVSFESLTNFLEAEMTGNFRINVGASFLILLLAGCGSSSFKTGQTVSPAPPVTPVTYATVSLSDTSFNFGDSLVGSPIQQTVVKVTNTGTIPLTLKPTLAGDPSYSIVAPQSCGTQLASGASCNEVVTYAPTTPSAPASQTAVLNLNFGNAAAGTPSTVNVTGMSAVMAAGAVTSTTNPLVALYTITPPFAGTVTVNFGTTTSYGMKTWSVPTPSGGGPVTIEVAGMRMNTAYHMQASIAFQNGTTANDIDHTFTTGTVPGVLQPLIKATTTAGLTPQPGIEMMNPFASGPAILATDLSGNIIWSYTSPTSLGGSQWFAPKQLANGDYIALAGINSSNVLGSNDQPVPVPAGAANLVREFDLVGNTVKEITMQQLNAALAASNLPNKPPNPLLVFHHDVTVLPNGHWLVLANTIQSVTLTGATSPTNVLGDVIVDLDTNLNPVWVWNEFDHLDPNRGPEAFPDWTHTNAIIYSKDDGDLLVSMRHQSWIVKVDYNNGAGTGNILWRLGYQGDFTLVGGSAPYNWFSGQHGPSFTTANTSGIFGLTVMDNGNFRQQPPGSCGNAGQPSCFLSSVPILQINETAKTATLTFHQFAPAALYNFFGGNAETVANGDVEYDLCGISPVESQIFEVTNSNNPQTVWNMTVNSNYVYRGYRLPSLYPGVQW
jgi:arylsulfate sulfotransferase